MLGGKLAALTPGEQPVGVLLPKPGRILTLFGLQALGRGPPC